MTASLPGGAAFGEVAFGEATSEAATTAVGVLSGQGTLLGVALGAQGAGTLAGVGTLAGISSISSMAGGALSGRGILVGRTSAPAIDAISQTEKELVIVVEIEFLEAA